MAEREILFKSTPTGANIYVGDRNIDGMGQEGVTPVTFTLEEGHYFIVRMEKEGYVPKENMNYYLSPTSIVNTFNWTLEEDVEPYDERIEDEEATGQTEDEILEERGELPEEEEEIQEETYPNEPIYLNPPSDPTVTEAKKQEVLMSMTEETRYPEVAEWLSSAEWAEQHRKLWADNHPTQAKLLGIAGTTALIGTGVIAAQGIGALAAAGGITATGTIAKTAAAYMGTDTLMVWMAEDNILTGLGFTVRKLREAYKAGAKTKAEVDEAINKIIEWAQIAEDVVRVSTTFNPLLIPFKDCLLANVEKSKLDLELEIDIIDKL